MTAFLDGKVVAITGAGGGIGRAVALAAAASKAKLDGVWIELLGGTAGVAPGVPLATDTSPAASPVPSMTSAGPLPLSTVKSKAYLRAALFIFSLHGAPERVVLSTCTSSLSVVVASAQGWRRP